MVIRMALVLGVALTASPVFAQKVFIEYDRDYDGGKIETFAWSETAETSVRDTHPLLHSRIVNGIEYYLSLSGAREDEEDPDVYVTYHTSTKTEVKFDTTIWGYGYPGGWGYWGGYGYPVGSYAVVSTSTPRTYERGTLVVDVWDARTKTLIWRGTAIDITVSDNPSKMEKRIDKALKKMVDEWRKIKSRRADQ